MRQPIQHTPKLPRQLLEELGGQSGDYGGKRRKKHTVAADRKEQRKAARKQKKSNHFSRIKQHDLARGSTHGFEEEEPDSPVLVKQSKVPAASVQPKAPKSILKVPKSTVPVKESLSETPSPSPSPPPLPKVSQAVQDRLAADNAEIAALEKALGVKGKKKLPKSFEEDGLDSLLEGVDDAVGIKDERSAKRKRSEEEQWLRNKRRKAQADVIECLNATEGTEDSASSSERESKGFFEDEDEVEGGTELDESDDSDLPSEHSERPLPMTSQKRTRENPYIAPITGDSVKYVPPSLRNKDKEEPEDLSRLRRQLQGLLNRLSEANILSILSDVESIYSNHPRQHVSTTLLDLLMGLLVDQTTLSDTFIILHAGFIAAVYKVVGTDFGAQAIQRIDEEFEHHHTPKSSSYGVGKKLTNLISLLAELYNFQVIGSNLIYDFVRFCLEDLSETNTELLLRITRSAGPQLRQDDPSSLRDIIFQLQSSVADIGEENLSVRTKFMIESLNQLKNNRSKRGSSASSIVSEHTVRMKKTLGSLNTRSLRAGEPLRIGIKDLRKRDKLGSWWLVGASYKGDGQEVDDRHVPTQRSQVNRFQGSQTDGIASDLIQLAKDQRMNTDVRRSIFVAIMSSSDCNDAYVRLMKLRLKRSQEFEMTKVLIHCAGAEKAYNPFYTFLSRRLCSDKKLKMSFQFSLWDLFKKMGEGEDDSDGDEGNGKLELRSLINLAKMFGVLVAEGGLGLGILKNLGFAYLQPKTQMFLEILFVTAILHCQQNSEESRNGKALLAIFLGFKEITDMAGGLQYFLKKVVRKTDLAGSKFEKETLTWACNTVCDALANLTTGAVIEE